MIDYDMSNEDYHKHPAVGSTTLKSCIRSVAHALTPKKPKKATTQGLRIHEFVLEPDVFKANYACGINVEDYPDALSTSEEIKAEVDRVNDSRLPKLKVTGGKDKLIETIMSDSVDHLAHVQDLSKISVDDLKNKINHINQAPNRGLLTKSDSILDLCQKLIDAGSDKQFMPLIEKEHKIACQGKEMIPYSEYADYEGMRESVLNHVRECAENEVGGTIMQWLNYSLSTGNYFTECSLFATDPSTGTEVKCRNDIMFKIGDKWAVFDLKKTKDASDDGFANEAARYGYDLQESHYTQVNKLAGIDVVVFGFIAVEPEPPYAVNVFISDEEFKELGDKKRNYALNLFTQAKETGKIQAYSTKPKQLTAPEWSKYGPWE